MAFVAAFIENVKSLVLAFNQLSKSCQCQVPLQVVTPLDAKLLNGSSLGLEGEHQYVNAALAIALCFTWLKRTGHVGDIYLEQTVSFKK